MADVDAALGEELRQIAVGQCVPQVLALRQQVYIRGKNGKPESADGTSTGGLD